MYELISEDNQRFQADMATLKDWARQGRIVAGSRIYHGQTGKIHYASEFALLKEIFDKQPGAHTAMPPVINPRATDVPTAPAVPQHQSFQMTPPKKGGSNIATLLVIAFFMLGGGFYYLPSFLTGTGGSHAVDNSTSNAAIPALADLGPQSIVNKAEFDRLENGMTYAKAVEIIGHEGEESSSSHMDGVPGVMKSVDTKMYIWKNADGSNMNAMFQNDKMMMKAQFGLK